jgi:guanine nucleotide-binding protein subunit alpha
LVDIGIFHPLYTGNLDCDEGLKYIQDCYFERNHSPTKTIYCHVTDATNTENVRFVWKTTKHIILEMNLTKSGLAMCY